MKRIASATPGRIRIRDTALREQERLQEVSARIQSLDAVTAVRPNRSAGSIVVSYDATQATLADMVDLVDACINDGETIAVAAPRPALQRKINRYAKYGALSTLGVSLAFAAAGAKRLHIISGCAFLVCLGGHLAVHRKSLLR
jgi:hypothetical protein